MRAVLQIAGDVTPLTRALSRIEPLIKRATNAIRGDFHDAMRSAAESAQATQQAYERAAQAIRSTSKALTKTASTEEKTRTKIVQQEGGYRTAHYREEVSQAEAVETRKTRAAQRGSDERRRIAMRALADQRRAAGEFGARAGTAAVAMGSAAIGMTRGAMNTAAGIETRMNDALVPAGYRDQTELRAARAAILARATSSGIGADRIADAMASSQEYTSMLSGRTSGERSTALQSALEGVDFAANSRQDIGQTLRLQGILAQQGVRGADARATMRALTGIGRAGSIEVGSLTREALGPLMQNVAFATGQLGPNATPAQRAAAVQQATVRTLAIGEVAAAGGGRARDSLNALGKLDRYTINDSAMGRLRERLMGRGASGRALAEQMFEGGRDAGGNQVQRLRGSYRDSMQMVSALLTHTGGNASEVYNMLGSAGRGRDMVLDAPTRRLIMGLASQTSNGESVYERTQRMAAEGSYTEADLAAEGAIRMTEQTTVNAANEENRRQGLSDNTSSLNRLTNVLDGAAAKHPLLAAAAPAAVTTVVAGALRNAATSAAGVGRSAVRLASRGASRAGFIASLLTPGNEDQGYFNDRAALNAARRGAAPDVATRAGATNNMQEFQASVAAGVREGMAQATVQIPPAAAQQVATQTALAAGARPTTGR